MLRNFLLPLLGGTLLASTAWSQQRTRPPSVPTFQEAIYAAAEGDTLYADRYAPPIKWKIDVDRPLTIVGGTYAGLCFSGPGYGRAVLIGARVLDARDIDQSYTGYATSGIIAFGFEELRLISSYVEATSPRGSDDFGRPALVALVPRLILRESEFHASGGSQFPDYTCGSVLGPGPASVHTGSGTVIATGSCFFGGAGMQYCFDDFSGNCGSAPSYTDPGGPGVVADRFFFADCEFVGGAGCTWTNRPEVGLTGPPFIANLAVPFTEGRVEHTR